MTGIADVSKKMKKKLSLGDYGVSVKDVKQQEVKKSKGNDVLTAKSVAVKKVKQTFYLTDVESRMVDEIYSMRLLAGDKTARSDLICEAIKLLYQQEVSEKGE